MSENGTGTPTAPISEPSGALTSREVPKKYPRQGSRPGMKIDQNKHGIRRETSLDPKPQKKGRPKKV
jgi:hypothetical protein